MKEDLERQVNSDFKTQKLAMLVTFDFLTRHHLVQSRSFADHGSSTAYGTSGRMYSTETVFISSYTKAFPSSMQNRRLVQREQHHKLLMLHLYLSNEKSIDDI